MWSKSSAERFIDQELLRTEIDVAPEDITLDDLEVFGKISSLDIHQLFLLFQSHHFLILIF